jgi:hypothetical protein
MSMAELMRQVAELPPEQQNELAALLLHLRLKRDPAWRAELTQRVDDDNPNHWVSLEDWKTELAKGAK